MLGVPGVSLWIQDQPGLYSTTNTIPVQPGLQRPKKKKMTILAISLTKQIHIIVLDIFICILYHV